MQGFLNRVGRSNFSTVVDLYGVRDRVGDVAEASGVSSGIDSNCLSACSVATAGWEEGVAWRREVFVTVAVLVR